MKHWALSIGSVILLAAVATQAHALPDITGGGVAGKFGAGAQAAMAVTPWLGARAMADGFSFGHTAPLGGSFYDGRFLLSGYGALLDVYPLLRGPRLSVGMFGNRSDAGTGGPCVASCTVVNLVNPARDAALLDVVKLNFGASYAGVGWGNAEPASRVYVSADVGVMFEDGSQSGALAAGRSVSDPSEAAPSGIKVDSRITALGGRDGSVPPGQSPVHRYYPTAMFSFGWRF